jgi:uncharacterized protein (TIGR03435 family)
MKMVRTSFPRVAISLLATAVVTFSAVAQNSLGDRAAKAPSGVGTEKEFKFEVLSIKPTQRGPSVGVSAPKPNGFSATALFQQVVLFAYGPPCPISMPNCAPTGIRNQPGWFAEPYAFDARVSQADLKAWQNQGKNYDLLRAALRAALKERCKLVIHKEPKQQPIMELVIAKGGPRLKAADPGATLPQGVLLESGGVMTFINNGHGGWIFHGATIQDFAYFLSGVSPGGPVRDRTGLTGRYDFTLRRDPEAPMTYYPEMLDALYLEGLGLKLKPGTEDRPDLVIDHVERPTQN